MREIKFIILRDNNGRLRHFFSDWKHHTTIARDNGFDYSQVIEAGILLDGQVFILECLDSKHLHKTNKFIGGTDYQDIRLNTLARDMFLKGREAESRYSYNVIGLGEGD